jgi:hypothetical protein
MSVRYPKKTKRATRVGAKGEGKTEEVKTINIRGCRSEDQLQQIALGLYHSLSRQELSVKLETVDMASYIDPTTGGQHNQNPDVLRLRPGTPVRVTVARQVQDAAQGVILTPLSEVFEKRTDEIAKALREQNGRFRADLDSVDGFLLAEQTARRISDALTAAKLTDLFYVRTLTHRLTASEGWSADMELVNFLESRSLPKNLSAEDKKIDELQRKVNALAKIQADAQVRVQRSQRGY